jgi:ABC-type transport system involved in multi-copper enzyme maturation permease subunit
MNLIARQMNVLIRASLLELYRRKDLVVVFILGAVLLMPLAFATPFGFSGAYIYFNEMALLMVWFFSVFITLGVSTRIFPYEFEKRTIYPLLAKPVSRGTVVLGRYFGALSASTSALVLFYAAYIILCGVRQHVWFSEVLVQAFVLHVGLLMVITAIGLTGSLLLTISANVTITLLIVFGMLLFGSKLPELADQQSLAGKTALYIAYAVAPHTEFFDLRQRLVHGWPAISWGVCAVVMAYAVAYSIACLFVADLLLRRKKL